MEIKYFFCNLPLTEQFIYILCDQDGNGIGEAVAQFKTEDFATRPETTWQDIYGDQSATHLYQLPADGGHLEKECVRKDDLLIFTFVI